MTIITLEVPDELAQKLQKLKQAELINTLEKILLDTEKRDLTLLPSASLPQPVFSISREAWYQQLLQISAWDEELLDDIEQVFKI